MVEAGVATHVDGVYVGRTFGTRDAYFDLQRVEVLRGPQGTLYGRNATGGSINIITARPQEAFEAQVGTILGDYERVGFEGYVTGPISEGKLLGRLAFFSNDRDGFLENLAGGPDLRDDNVKAGRLSLTYTPGDDWQFDLIADYSRKDYSGDITQNLFGTISPTAPIGTISSTDPTKVATNKPNATVRDTWGVTLMSGKKLDGMDFKSTTAFRDYSIRAVGDLNATTDPRPFGTILQNEQAHQVSQEFNLASTDAGPFQWVAGLYGYYEVVRADFNPVFPVIDLSGNPVFPPVDVVVIDSQVLPQHFQSSSLAAYGQGTYSVTDDLRATVGLRYTRDHKNGSAMGADTLIELAGGGLGSALLGLPLPFTLNYTPTIDNSWYALTPKAGLEYDLGETALLYGSVTRGYKSGNSNLSLGNTKVVKPEYVWSYELGLKSQLFDNKLRANFDVFYYDYTNFQAFGIAPGSGTAVAIFENAASASVQGFDMELLARPVDRLEMNLAYSYVDAEFGDFLSTDSFLFGFAAPVENLKGRAMPRSPTHTLNVGAQYEIPMTGFSLTPRVEFMHRSRIYYSNFQHRSTSQDPFSTVNARLTMVTDDGRWYGALFVKNVTDEHYLENVNETPGGGASAFYGEPRTIGVEISTSFN
jgi:iron complex outermembrane receptor protein